jgi:hypothetical protein
VTQHAVRGLLGASVGEKHQDCEKKEEEGDGDAVVMSPIAG